MTKKLFYGLLIVVTVTLSLFTACKTATSTTATSSQPAVLTTTSTQSPVTTSAATTGTNWWDKFGTPQYGGEISVPVISLAVSFDNYNFVGGNNCYWFETLFQPDWTVDPADWNMAQAYTPDNYWANNIAESWQMTDSTTLTVKIRQGVKFQDKAPVNGREFTAYDIQAHYERLLGQGKYTAPAPMYAGMTKNWASVTATDKYTVVFKFKTPSATTAFQTIADRFALNTFEAPEWVALDTAAAATTTGGTATNPLQDWHNAVGTGPWMLTDYIAGSQMTFNKNPTYWGTDPRHPQNQIPYVDSLNILCIPDSTTQLAALRTAKIDMMASQSSVSWRQAATIKSSNPELIQTKANVQPANGIVFKQNASPFTDIRVRTAMQMAVNLPEMAKSLYGGNTDGTPCGLVTQLYKGYCYSYEDWPQTLKDEYTFNPAKAKQLLAEAGYPDGFKTNIVADSTNTASLDILQSFKSYFMDIGIDMEIKTMNNTEAQAFLRAGKHDQLAASQGGYDTPPTRTIDLFSSKGSDAGISAVNDSVYDAVAAKFWAAGTSEEAMTALQEADKRVIEQHWAIYMAPAPAIDVVQPYLKGYTNETLVWGAGLIYAKLWINKSAVK